MKDFIAGRIDIKVFKHEFDTNCKIKNTLVDDPLCPKNTRYLSADDKDIVRFIESCNWLRAGGQLCVWGEIRKFLERYNYPVTPAEHYKKVCIFMLKIQPTWLDITDEQFLETHILSKIPEGLTKAKQIAWCKARLKEMFRCDKSPPRWVQGPEWPILEGKPLVFRRQIKDKNDTERMDYVFYNPDTLAEHVVTQWY